MLSHEYIHEETPVFFHMSGRIGRLRMVVYTAGYNMLFAALTVVVVTVLGGADGPTPLLAVVGAVGAVFVLLLPMWRRLHDLDRSGWWAVLMFVPLINLLLLLYLLLMPGNNDVNGHGAPPTSNSLAIKCFAGLIILLTVVLPFMGVAGVFGDAYQDYQLAQEESEASFSEQLQGSEQLLLEPQEASDPVSALPADQALEGRIKALEEKLRVQQE
jgi:uncharacterized membrane protein YhaH (DUF805 family)